MKLRLILAAILCMGFWTLPAGAEGTSCGFPTMVVADGRLTRSTIPASTTFFYAWNSTVGRSYSAEMKSAVAAFNIAPGTVTNYDGNGGVCTTPLTTRDTTGIEPQILSGTRRNWISAHVLQWVKIENLTANPIDYTFSVSETTMFSPRWSTFGGFYTSWGIYNTTNSSCFVSLFVSTAAGTPVGGSPVFFSVPTGTVTFRDTRASDLNVAASQAGKVSLIHDCPPGALLVDGYLVNDSAAPAVIVPVKFETVREATH